MIDVETWTGPAEGTTRAMHRPRNMVALGPQDLCSSGLYGRKAKGEGPQIRNVGSGLCACLGRSQDTEPYSMDGQYVTRGTRRFAGRFAKLRGRFTDVSQVFHTRQ
jgi:hypothetical protein